MEYGIFRVSDSGDLRLVQVIKSTKKEAEFIVKEMVIDDGYNYHYVILKLF